MYKNQQEEDFNNYQNSPNIEPQFYHQKQQQEANRIKERLYDKGFKQRTMPSVKRTKLISLQSQQDSIPKSVQVEQALLEGSQQFQNRPQKLMKAKLSSYQHRQNNKLEPIRYQNQSIALHQQSNSVNLKSNNKISGLAQSSTNLKNSQVFNSNMQQQTRYNQPNLDVDDRRETQFSKFPKSNKSMSSNQDFFGAKKKDQDNQQEDNKFLATKELLLDSGIDFHSQMYKTSSLFNLPQLQHKPQLPQLGSTIHSDFNYTQDNFYESVARSRPQPFGQKEFKRTKKLVDKISGKYNIEQRYLEKKGKKDMLQITEDGENDDDDKKDKNNQPDRKQRSTKLYTYIDYILKGVTNIEEYIYLIRASTDDPYDLEVSTYEDLKKKEQEEGLKEYYIISRKGLCHYVNGKPIEFIQLAYWLKERETYDQIIALNFFTKFRKWKTLKMWRKNVIKEKTQKYAKDLEEKLFILNPILRETLLDFRKDTQNMMENVRFISLENKDKYSTDDSTHTLEKFKELQEYQRKKINDSIQEFSKNCRKTVQDGFEQSLNQLKKNQYMNQNDDDLGGQKKGNQNFFRLKESAYENLGFSDNMSYERRSELRKECSKFLRFSYLVDFLAMESLSQIYTLSCLQLEVKLRELTSEDVEYVVTDAQQKGGGMHDDPLFQLNLESQFDSIETSYVMVEQIKEFKPPPIGDSKDEEFNPLYHIKMKPEKNEEEEQQFQKKDDFEDDEVYIDRQIVPMISELWLKMTPDREAFSRDIIKCIAEGKTAIQCFERWSRSDDMTKYVSVLEEWDDHVGNDWQNPDSNYLNPSDWIEQNDTDLFNTTYKPLIDTAYDKCDNWIKKQYDSFLLEYWELQQLDLNIFKQFEQFDDSDMVFRKTLKKLTAIKDSYDQKLPTSVDLGLFRIDTQELRKKLLPSPKQLLDELEKFMPGILKTNMQEVKTWMTDKLKNMHVDSIDLKEFAQQQITMAEIQETIGDKKDRLNEIKQIVQILQSYNFEITKEDQQYFNANTVVKNLDDAIQKSEENKQKKQDFFLKRIRGELIPQLLENVQKLNQKVQDPKYIEGKIEKDVAIKELGEYVTEMKELVKLGLEYNNYEGILDDNNQTQFDEIDNLKMDLQNKYDMWKSSKDWHELIDIWMGSQFNDIQNDKIKEKVDYYDKILRKCEKQLPAGIPTLIDLKESVSEFKNQIPIVRALRNDKMQEYHWDEILRKVGQEFDVKQPEFTLKTMVEMKLGQFKDEIVDISTQATQEHKLEKELEEVEKKWTSLQMETVEYKQGINVLTGIDDLNTELDEILAAMNNILGSRYLKKLRNRAEQLQFSVLNAQDTLGDWLNVQKNWQYLENLFNNSSDIKATMIEESRAFDKIQNFFKEQMSKVEKRHRLIAQIMDKNSKKNWEKQNEALNDIQKALDDLLQDKRRQFPRFFFLSNDELLEIISNSADIQAVEKNLKKCFDGVSRLKYDGTYIQGLKSPEGEILELKKQFNTTSSVEQWLKTLEESMRDSIKNYVKKGKKDYYTQEDKQEWVKGHHAQIVACVENIIWTEATESAFEELKTTPDAFENWALISFPTMLDELISMVASNTLNKIQLLSVVALITQDVHARDILYDLNYKDIQDATDFSWQKELRYYSDGTQGEDFVVKQVNATIKYGNEYMGATTRLVITKLTDRCWMTITGALNIQLGAAPAGPAGTGKTESTKDLAKALGQLCIVFNCSDQIEYKMMQRLFTGLCTQGAWTCLDEFNRIDIEVLSVVAQQLQTIRAALLRRDEQFIFGDGDSKPIVLKAEGYGVFITMNPGYAGRTELPDNLKVLFRPVAMMIPDYGIIAQIMLLAEGFKTAVSLSKKMVQLYKLSSEQLSQQDHYDFGMRAVKSVLNMAGGIKRANQKMEESTVLIRAMKDANIPKFLKQDLPLFNALIQDLFPNVEIEEPDYGKLPAQIKLSLKRKGLQFEQALADKVVQLYETFNVRFGVMLVGLTNSAKTTCFEVLQDSMTQLYKSQAEGFLPVQTKVLNPKCITMGELYGEVNIYTQEWTDGLASNIMRNWASSEANENQWVVFDGPVDALWIENMNTVLDDNKMLCLANGQRIKLRDQMRMLFEVQDLKVASPATVSRCGMVYLMYEDIGWRPYVQSWLDRVYGPEVDAEGEIIEEAILEHELREHIFQLFEKSIDEFLELLRRELTEPIQTVDLQLVISLCNLFESFLIDLPGLKYDKKIEYQKRFINHIFTYSFVWSMCITVHEKHVPQLDQFVKSTFPSTIFPNPQTVFSYYLDTSDLMFKHWDSLVQPFEYNPAEQYFSLLVPTIDTTRFSYITEYLLNRKKHVYVTGVSGIGKSVILSGKLTQIKESRKIDHFSLIFSAQTSSKITQLAIEAKLNKVSKTQLTAKPGRRTCIFIDDVNMPAVEQYGAQPPIELLRLLVDKNGFYDRKERTWKNVSEYILMICSAPPGGGRSNITQRFSRHFNILNLPQPSNETLTKIFESILGGFFEKLKFPEAVRQTTQGMVRGTIEVFQRIQKEKKPIPSKFHYTFNLRDVSKVFMGVMMVSPVRVRDENLASKIWIHENSRVFHDRLINEDDKDWFYDLLMEIIQREFKTKYEKESVFQQNKIFFTDIHKLEADVKYYEFVNEQENKRLMMTLDTQLDNYNADHSAKMNLVFFSDCVEHILRVSRILRSPRGSAMLIGVGGSGKQSLTRLSSYMLDFDIRTIEIVKNYKITHFRDFIKALMMQCIKYPEGKGITFLFTDTQIIDEGFLEDINNILNSGEVPNLWPPDELKEALDETRPLNEKKKRAEDPDTIYKTFVEKVRNDLHIVLCMSPVGDALRIRCRKFPSLVDCCGLDWFSQWPAEALISVAKRIFLDTADFPKPKSTSFENLVDSLSVMCKEVHTDATEMTVQFEEELKRKVYTTPKSYLDLIKLYIQQLLAQRQKVGNYKDKLANGYSKLHQAKEQIADLKVQLTELEPILIQKSKEVEVAQKQVNEDKKIADEKEEVVQDEADKVQIQKSQIEQIAGEAQAELDKVLPELQKAQKAVENIDKNALTQIRGASSPPDIVALVFEAVCILFGEKNTDWKSAQRLMQNLNGFIAFLQSYDVAKMDEKTSKKLKKVLAHKDFNVAEITKRVSSAGDIAGFCVAMDKFSDIKKVVKPKQDQVSKLQAELKIVEDALAVKNSELQVVKDKVAALNKELQAQVKLKQELDDKKKLTALQLKRAGQLIELTADESVRWQETVKDLEEELENQFGDVFLCVAGISYNGPFTGVYRDQLIEKWGEKLRENCIPMTEKYDIIKTLGEPMLIREWIIKGLPSDPVSQENSIYTTKGYRWPLLIDPQLQARKWIVNKEYDPYEEVETFFILKFSNSDFIGKMTLALSNGYAVLIQDVDEFIDPSIDAILGKAVYEQDGQKLIKFPDKEISYDDRFRLYLMTKKPNPNYLAEIYIKVNVINFTATFEGLNDQLLAIVVGNEQEQVEKDRDNNIKKLADCKSSIEQFESQILDLLKKTEADEMLNDDILITTLQSSKKSSQEIAIELKKSSEDEVKINEIRNSYKPVAMRGAILYFVIKDLALIDPMYQYSLQAVTRLFKFAIQTATEAEELEERLQHLISNITKTMYQNVCRGLFERHKLIFSFLISTSINKQAQILDTGLFSLLLKGAGNFDKTLIPDNPEKDRIQGLAWELAGFLDVNYEQFKDLTKDISNAKTKQGWLDYIMCADPIQKSLPDDWENKVDIFGKMLIIKILRPEKLMFMISEYVHKYMGQFYLEPPPTLIQKLYEDSDNQTPIIFVLSQGADPTSQIESFAKVMNMEQKLQRISLGQGQGDKAEKLITDGKEVGNWVFLQNCHLDKTFMPRLENIVNQFEEDAEKGLIHEDFRLFLTSMPAPYFPVAVLQAGIKVTNEPPRGLKANLKRSWANIDEEFLVHETKPNEFQKLVWGLTFFHAIIQERRKFGPLGWNIRYEFNDSDLECSTLVMKMLLKENDEIPWDSLLFVSGHINYGGRVTDDWDRRCLITILRNFYTTEILNNTYNVNDSQTYIIPPIGTLESYREYIETLPLQDDPGVFGMHENANITYQQQESNKIIDTILSIQPRTSGGAGGKSSDEIILEMIEQLLEEMPPILNQEDGNQELFIENEMGLIPSLSTVLLQEIHKFNGLVQIMTQSLTHLKMAIGGQMVMSQELDSVYSSMLNNQVPIKWQKYPSLKPLASWIVDLRERVQFMKNWLMEGNPICYWMSGFFFPQGFLTGVLQTHARKTQIAIDQLYFSFRILQFDKEQCVARPSDGVYIYGLFLEGAQFDKKSSKQTITDSAPGIMYFSMPVICFIPSQLPGEDASPKQKVDVYECPVYKTSVRAGVLSTTGQSTNFVLAVDIPNLEQTEEYWIQRGAALLCQLDY